MATWEIGDIDNSPVGQTTPAAGAFTVLKAGTDPVDADGVGDRGYNDLRYADTSHAADHTDGSDDIQDATAAQKGLATATQITKLDNIEAAADITDADNVMTAGALMKVSSTTVAFNAVAATTLYTVPTGKTFIPVFTIIRAGADAAATDVTLGRSTALTDFMGTTQLDNLDASGDQVLLMPVPQDPPLTLKTYAAAVVFQINVTVASGGASNTVDLFGYLV